MGADRIRKIVGRSLLTLSLVGTAGAVGFAATRPAKVEYVEVTRGTAVRAVYASGVVEPVDRVDLRPRIAGALVELSVREGDVVKAGQVLGRLDAAAMGHEVTRGKADLAAAESRAAQVPTIVSLEAQKRDLGIALAQAKRDRDRIEKLHDAGAIPDRDCEASRDVIERLESQIASLSALQNEARINVRSEAAQKRAVLDGLTVKITDTELRAPIAGVVLAKHVNVGEMVDPTHAVLKIGDTSRLRIEAEVDEADVARIKDGMVSAVRVFALDDGVFAAKVERVLPDADRTRKTFPIHLVFDRVPDGVRPGMSAEVNVVLERHDGALLIPVDAIKDGSVWVVSADGHVCKKAVEVGIRDLATVEVHGLNEGDRVVIGSPALKDGDRVDPKPAPPPKRAKRKDPPPAVQ